MQARDWRRVVVLAGVAALAVAVPAVAGAQREARALPYADLVGAAAARHGIDPLLVHAVIAIESAHRPDAVSPAGAQGLMQLMPSTAGDYGVVDAFDPEQNVEGGVAYLRALVAEFGTVLALAAYNAGPGNVRRHGGIPPFAETRRYVRAVVLGLIRLRAGYPVR